MHKRNSDFRGLYFDESNHFKDPEAFVGYFSPYIEDSNPVLVGKYDEEKDELIMKPGLTKVRRKELRLPGDLQNRKFRYLLLTRKDLMQVFGRRHKEVEGLEEKIKIIAISTMVRHFEPLDLLIIDGMFSGRGLYMIESLTRFALPKQIIVAPKADETYPGVHQADRIAYRLYRYHDRKREGEQYEQYRLKPSLEEYSISPSQIDF